MDERTRSREAVFDGLLSALGAEDPLASLLTRAASLCGGAGQIVNEMGELVRRVGAAPAHLITEWVNSSLTGQGGGPAATGPGSVESTSIGRWAVSARFVRIRQRRYAVALAVQLDDPDAGAAPDVDLVLDTIAKLLLAFEGFESFSISTRKEESARLLRDIESGISPGREPAFWRLLENFGFIPYRPVRMVRARLAAASAFPASAHLPHHSSSAATGIIVDDSGRTATVVEQTALCAADLRIDEHFGPVGVIGLGVSEPFVALSQAPEMMRTADVALAAALPGQTVLVDDMRPVEWAAARMSSRFDRAVISRFIDRLTVGPEARATVESYFANGANIAAAARELSVHENTVRYRLGQVEQMLGGRLADPRISADVALALECQRIGRHESDRSQSIPAEQIHPRSGR